uniref:Uncharacterized protein n=1 Tax=Steinernema glaseri TaxID=37863 RepID=A0A1I7YET1_9BILA
MKKTASERQRNLERQFGPNAPKVRFGTKFFQSLYWALRGCQYWLCFYDTDIEVDVEDLLANPFNTQPPSLDELERLTGFKREWIMFVYRNFKQVIQRSNANHFVKACKVQRRDELKSFP